MIDPSRVPNLESFEIEIMETWTEADIFTRNPIVNRFTDLARLGDIEPSFGDPKYRQYNPVSLDSILLSTYDAGRIEKQVSRNYIDTSKNSRADGGRIDRIVTCKIRYKATNADQPSAATA